jgi:hypothetical protein
VRGTMVNSSAVRFPILFDSWYRGLSTLLLLRPSRSYLEVLGNEVQVRMGWGFRARFPKSAVVSVSEYRGPSPLSRGVHGLLGRWLVNGSGRNLVAIDLEPRQRAYVIGLPVRLHQLIVSVEDPAAVIAALSR